jgi:hypothetical protein
VARKGTSRVKTHDEHGNMIDHVPIDTFITTLDSLHKDEWRARTLAFEALTETLPGSDSGPSYSQNSGIMPWYKSYTALRKLAPPISSLLLNARSTVVKHTTQHLTFLVQTVKEENPPNSDMCKYLLKDLVPTILAMHAQTVKLIRSYALEAMEVIIPLCRYKSGLPVLLERLRKDRSRDVREFCVVYLRLIVQHWSGDRDVPPEQEYLTKNICNHIGNGLARALMDPSQNVRTEARNSFELYRHRYPRLWEEIVKKPDGIFSKDSKLKKSLVAAAAKAGNEGADIDDYYPSYEEGEDYDTKTLGSVGSKSSLNSWKSNSSFVSQSSKATGGFRAAGRSTSRTKNSRPAARTSTGPLPPASKRTGPFGNLSERNASKGSTSNGSAHRKPKATRKQPVQENTENTPPARVPTTVTGTKPSENYNVSNQLLAAHKLYIDDLMESLRAEMNTVRDFETLLVKSQSNPDEDGTYGPAEDAVLKYYEAVYSYLDKGTASSAKLRTEMERISAISS